MPSIISTLPPSPPSTSPSSLPPPATLTEEVQQNNGAAKQAKSKTTRPSAEPYVPPSRRSLPANKEPPPPSPASTSSTNENKNEDSEEEEDWEKLLDGNDNPLNNDLIEEVKLQTCFSIIRRNFVFLRFKKNSKKVSK